MDGRDTSDDIDLSDRRVVAVLLAATVEFVTGDAATITAVNQLPIAEGSSGAALSRVDVTYTTRHVASASIGLVLKMCSDIELAVLLRLQAAHPRHTPYIQSSPILRSGPDTDLPARPRRELPARQPVRDLCRPPTKRSPGSGRHPHPKPRHRGAGPGCRRRAVRLRLDNRGTVLPPCLADSAGGPAVP